MHEHTLKAFDADIDGMRSAVITMGGLVEKQFTRAADAVLHGDLRLISLVLAEEAIVNQQHVQADLLCNQILARRQPIAIDLREVLASIHTVNDLERIGDEAKIIAQKTLSIHARGGRPHDGISLEMDRLATIASQRVQGALDSLARLDVNQAWTLVRADKAEDLFQDILRSLGACPVDGELALASVIDVALALKALQRVADRAQNLAEYVIYIVEGQDVRHGI